jgi:hypothetical protein
MLNADDIIPNKLYPPGVIAGLFAVDPKTVVRWIKGDKFGGHYIRTPGGHHRVYGRGLLVYLEAEARQEEASDGA